MSGLVYGPSIVGIQANDSPVYAGIPDDPTAYCGRGSDQSSPVVARAGAG